EPSKPPSETQRKEQDNAERLPYRQSMETGVIGWVAREGRSYLARDVRADPNYIYPFDNEDPVCSELAIPLRRGSEIVGALDVQSYELDSFDASDVAALETLAAQISTTFDKSQTLTIQQKRALQLELVGEIAARATVIAEPDEM